ALAVINVGPHLGIVLGLVIGGLVAPSMGWRSAFLLAGGPGLIFGLVFWLTVREPIRGSADVGQSAPSGGSPNFVARVVTLWSDAAYRNLILAGCLFAFVGIALGTWMPSFMARSYGMALSSVGPLLGLVVLITGPLSTILGGLIGDRLSRRGEGRSLLLPIAGGLLGLPLMCAAILTTNLPLTLILYGLGTMSLGLHIGPIFGLIQNVAPPHLRGLAAAFLVMFNSLVASGLGPLVVGAASDALEPRYGAEALRLSMALSTLAFVPAIAFTALALRALRRAAPR
ncbi:MAG: major facilitator superfamily transporter, partial [Caulobacteraceae bacterium]|nr:major facilitator superfamily transporter [Caulobacteraceae bacterium]